MLKYNLIKSSNYLDIMISIILMLSAIYNYTKSSYVMCIVTSKCNNQTSTTMCAMFPRVVAIACMISRITVTYKNMSAISNYKMKIKKYEHYFPINATKELFKRLIIVSIVFTYVILILPINVYRIYLLCQHYADDIVIIIFFSFMYIQNASMCITELQFIMYCFGLYQTFQLINEEISVLRSKTIVANKYPLVLKSNEDNKNSIVTVRRDDDFSSPITKDCPLVNSIELLKFRHQYVRVTVFDLNELYGIQLGLSLSVLFIMSLFDIYEVMSNEFNITKTNLLFYGWLLQYSFRFCTIILIIHITTTQVITVYNLGLKSYNIFLNIY